MLDQVGGVEDFDWMDTDRAVMLERAVNTGCAIFGTYSKLLSKKDASKKMMTFQHWAEWQEALELSFRPDKRRGLPTAHHLGRWLHGVSEPTAIEVPAEDRVYLREKECQWRVYTKARGRRSRLGTLQYSRTDGVVSSPPEDGLWATAWGVRDDLLTLTGSATVLRPGADSSRPLSKPGKPSIRTTMGSGIDKEVVEHVMGPVDVSQPPGHIGAG